MVISSNDDKHRQDSQSDEEQRMPLENRREESESDKRHRKKKKNKKKRKDRNHEEENEIAGLQSGETDNRRDEEAMRSEEAQTENKKSEKKKKRKKADEEFASVPENCESEMFKKKKEKKRDRTIDESSVKASDSSPTPQGFNDSKDEKKASNRNTQQPELHMGLFMELASLDSAARESAALTLAQELMEVQRAYEESGGVDSESGGLRMDAAKDDYLKGCAPTLRYALRRLIRGVSSSRACARQGFALGFAAAIGAIPSIDVNSLFKLIEDLLEVTSSMKGQEARESLLGRLFAYGAIVRSGRLTEEKFEGELLSNIFQCLLSLAEKKYFLREPVVHIILDLAEKIPNDTLITAVQVVPLLKEWLGKGPESCNPDALMLALRIYDKLPLDMRGSCTMLPQAGTMGDIFTTEHMSYLVPVLKETSFCHPRMHSIWQVLVDILFADPIDISGEAMPSHSNKKRKKGKKHNTPEKILAKKLASLWSIVVEGSLLSSSHDRKHLAISIFLMILPRLPASCIEIVLSHTFVHCLLDSLSGKDNHLYKIAQQCLQELLNNTADNDQRRVAIILALQQNSDGRFDSITKTQFVRDLIGKFNSKAGCVLLVQELVGLFLEGNHSELSETTGSGRALEGNGGVSNSRVEHASEETQSLETIKPPDDVLRSWIINSLYTISKTGSLDHAGRLTLQKEILKFLAIQGLFTASLSTEVTSFELLQKLKWPKQPASTHVRKLCIEKMQQILADAQHLMYSSKHLELNAHVQHDTNPLESTDLGAYMMCFLGTLQNIPSVSLYWSLSKDDQEIFSKLRDAEAQLFRSCNKDDHNYNKIQAMRYLLIQLLLQIPLKPDEISETASELLICCNKAFDNIIDNIVPCTEDLEEDPVVIDVLVDTLLSILPHSPTPVRSAVEQVFRCFCESITESGIMNMLRVIKNDLKPARYKFTVVEESDEEDAIDVEEAASGDDVEESEDEGDSSDDNQENRVKNSTHVDEGDLEHSDSDLDDEAMFKMDKHLVQILKTKKDGGQSDAHVQLKNFKLRVLSLLEYFLQRNSSSPYVLTIFSYFIQAYVTYSLNECNRDLAERIGGLIQRRICKGKDYPKGQVELTHLEDLLQKILKLVCRSKDSKVLALSQDCVYWLLKVIHGNFDESDLKNTADVFSKAVDDFFVSKKSRIKASFIREVLKRHHWLGVQIFGTLIKHCQAARSEFLQYEALSFMDEILKPLLGKSAKVPAKTDNLDHLKFLKGHLPLLSELIQCLLQKGSKQKTRRKELRQFCMKILKAFSILKLEKSFAKLLKPDCISSFESHLGEVFRPLKRLIK